MVGAFTECARTAKIGTDFRSGFTFGDRKRSSGSKLTAI